MGRNKYEIINRIIKKYNYQNYLEIGVRHPDGNFNLIDIDHKDGVDPVPLGPEINYPISSDEFFDLIKGHDDIKYDIIFIDGLHLHHQVFKDIQNSLNHLEENGTIILHDCNPITEDRQVEEYIMGKPWNGTTWKGWVEYRCKRDELEMFVIDADEGCGIIRKGKQNIWNKDEYNNCIKYSYLNKNRKALLNLISFDEFIKWLG